MEGGDIWMNDAGYISSTKTQVLSIFKTEHVQYRKII